MDGISIDLNDLPEDLRASVIELAQAKCREHRMAANRNVEFARSAKLMALAEKYSYILLRADPAVNADALAIRSMELAERMMDAELLESSKLEARLKEHAQ